MEQLALIVGYVVIAMIVVSGAIYLVLFALARMPSLPYFISYRQLIKKDDKEFEKWIENLRYFREWEFKKAKGDKK